MPRIHYTYVPEVALMLTRGDRIFLIRRRNTGYKDGEWCMPAGHKEASESPLAAAIREGREEAGVEVAVEDMTFLHVMQRFSEHERVLFLFRAERWEGEPSNVEPEKADAGQWFALTALPENMVDYHRQALSRVAAGEAYSEASI